MTPRRRIAQADRVPPSAEDKAQSVVLDICAKNMARWLKRSVNIGRPISTLNINEMRGLAQEAIGTWIAERLKQHPREACEQNPESVLNLMRAG